MSETTITTAIDMAEALRPNYVHVLAQFYPVILPDSKSIVADRFLRLYYDPEAIAEWELDWAASHVLIQVEHYYRRHSQRQNGRNQVCWDVATFIAITDSLAEEGLKFPPGTLFPQTFGFPDGLTAEEYCLRLFKLCMKRKGNLEQQLAEQAGQELPTFGSAGSENTASWDIPEDADIPTLDYLLALMQLKAMEPEQTIPGTQAGNQVRTVIEQRRESVDWLSELRSFHGSILSMRPGTADYTFAMPDPEIGLHPGLIMPGMGDLTAVTKMVIDSSGSMGESRLAQAVAEISSILRSCDGMFYVLSCDTAVSSIQQVFHPNEIQIVGGGGTDMGVGINAAATHYPRPDVIVVVTDGDTSWPKKGPQGIPVIIVLVGHGKAPTWAHKVITVPMG